MVLLITELYDQLDICPPGDTLARTASPSEFNLGEWNWAFLDFSTNCRSGTNRFRCVNVPASIPLDDRSDDDECFSFFLSLVFIFIFIFLRGRKHTHTHPNTFPTNIRGRNPFLFYQFSTVIKAAIRTLTIKELLEIV